MFTMKRCTKQYNNKHLTSKILGVGKCDKEYLIVHLFISENPNQIYPSFVFDGLFLVYSVLDY